MKSQAWLAICVGILVLSLFYFINPNRLSLAVPQKVEGHENLYQVTFLDAEEVWDHPNILSEPRLNFVLRENTESPSEQGSESLFEDAIYSLRLDGTDLRKVISLDTVESMLDGKIEKRSVLKRSASNRYLALSNLREEETWLVLIDLSTEKIFDVSEINRFKQYFWLHDQELIFYVTDSARLMLFDPELNEATDITERFRLPTISYQIELYSEHNKLGIFNDRGFSIYNFETGALLERSHEVRYTGQLATNPLYRHRAEYAGGKDLTNAKFIYIKQGDPWVTYERPISYDFERHLVEFGPAYLYQALGSKIHFQNALTSDQEMWLFNQNMDIENLSISGFKESNYRGVYCQSANNVTANHEANKEAKLDICGASLSWNYDLPHESKEG